MTSRFSSASTRCCSNGSIAVWWVGAAGSSSAMPARDAAPGTASQPQPRDVLLARLGKSSRRNLLRFGHAQEHAIAGRAGCLWVAIGAQPLGRSRDRNQQRALGDREACRLLAEIGEARGAHAFEIAAERRQGQVEA